MSWQVAIEPELLFHETFSRYDMEIVHFELHVLLGRRIMNYIKGSFPYYM